MIRFEVPGEPRVKERPRKGANGHIYTPTTTINAEHHIGWKYRQAAGPNTHYDPTSRFRVECDFYCASRSRKDADNMLKLVLDGLNGIAFQDDSHVMQTVTNTFLTPAGGEPGTIITITKIDPAAMIREKPHTPGHPVSVVDAVVRGIG